MEILKRFQADRVVRRLLSGAGASDTQLAAARSQLLGMGGAAVRALFATVQGAPASALVQELLIKLLEQETLAWYLEALRSPSATVAEAAARALANGGGYDATQLLGLYSDEHVPRARLELILDSQHMNLQPSTLLKVLPDLSKEARNSAFRLLDKVADGRLLHGALELSTHPEWWIRMHMARLLAKQSSPAAAAGLGKLVRDENSAVRMEAIRAVVKIRAVEAIPSLCTRLRDQDMMVQNAAIEALVQLADVSAVPHLLDALKDESEYVRRGAVEVLNQVITPAAIKDLVAALRDADWWVRARSADALGTLGGPRVVDAVMGLTRDPDEFARRYAIEILNVVPDPRAVPVLIDALDDEDWWVRERAVDALGKARDGAAVAPLLSMLSRDTRALPLCVRALGQIGVPEVVEPLCRLSESSDPETRREALGALVSMTERELPEESRVAVMAALDKAGVRLRRTYKKQKPLGVRTGRSVESRPAETTASPSPAAPSPTPRAAGEIPRSGDAGAAPASQAIAHNFQKLAPGAELLGRFRVVQRVGGGGFGTVYLVEDGLVNEQLVLKILSPQLSMDPNMIRRFVQELKVTRRISHPNVIRIYDLVDLEGAHAISMEYFAARDLGGVLREGGPLSPARAMHVAEQTLEGLAAAHAQGVLHRDIKPANLLVGDADLVKIVDFGLASVGNNGPSRLTKSGILVGTPEYISPEQITGGTVDARCDLYSLGVVLYESISGRQPFTGSTPVSILFQHIEATPPPLMSVAAGIPPAVNEVVMRAMARAPGDRPESALAMLEMVRAAR
jgi:serine/threonine-protein kinase